MLIFTTPTLTACPGGRVKRQDDSMGEQNSEGGSSPENKPPNEGQVAKPKSPNDAQKPGEQNPMKDKPDDNGPKPESDDPMKNQPRPEEEGPKKDASKLSDAMNPDVSQDKKGPSTQPPQDKDEEARKNVEKESSEVAGK